MLASARMPAPTKPSSGGATTTVVRGNRAPAGDLTATHVPAGSPGAPAPRPAPRPARGRIAVKALVAFLFLCWAMFPAYVVAGPRCTIFGFDLFAVGILGLVAVPVLAALAQGADRSLELLGDPDDGPYGGTALPVVMSFWIPAAYVVWGMPDSSGPLGAAPFFFIGGLWVLYLAVDSKMREMPVPVFFLFPCFLWGFIASEAVNASRYGAPQTYETTVQSASKLPGISGAALSGYELEVGGPPAGERSLTVKLRSPNFRPESGMPVKVTMTRGLLGIAVVQGVTALREPHKY